MRKYYQKIQNLMVSRTAKDTYILFIGNAASAFLGFLFTILVARNVSVSDFGIFSAINNLVIIIASVADIGFSTALVNFVAGFKAKGELEEAKKYLKAALILRIAATTFFILPVLIFPKFISLKFLASESGIFSFWVAALSIGILFSSFFPIAIQAYSRFAASIFSDLSLGVSRTLIVFIIIVFSGLTIEGALTSFFLGTVIAAGVGFSLIGGDFLKERVSKGIYLTIARFAGWIGVAKVVGAIAGKLDVTMLAVFAGATATGLYSIPSRVASFVLIIASSFSQVLAPRLASYQDREKEKAYIVKATLALIPISLGFVFWIVFAKPFILVLFGEKYISSVPIFQALTAAMIPFFLATPASTAVIYSLKKPVFIGIYSIFQLIAIFALNLFLIPKYGVYAPTLSFAFVNVVLCLFVWTICFKHYFSMK